MDSNDFNNTAKTESSLYEEKLIERVIAGDTSSVCELFGQYDSRAKAIAKRFLGADESRIEDVIQEAMMRAYLNLAQLRDKQKFGNWYLKIVRNLAIDAAKSTNNFAEKSEETSIMDFESYAAYQNNELKELADMYIRTDVIDLLMNELDVLDADYGLPIKMRYIDELSYNEIAEILDKPLGTVKSLIHRGKAILRERIDAKVGSVS